MIQNIVLYSFEAMPFMKVILQNIKHAHIYTFLSKTYDMHDTNVI